MLRKYVLILMMLLAVGAVAAGCGGGDDDDSDDSDNPFSSGDDDKGDSKNSKDNDVDVPTTIKDGVLEEGKVHLEVSGDKDFKIDTKGSGFVNGGFAILNFADSDATVMLTFQAGSKDEQGGLSVTTKDMSTAGAWGADCSVSLDDGAKELKGEFSCKELNAVSPTTTKSFDVKISGTFALPR